MSQVSPVVDPGSESVNVVGEEPETGETTNSLDFSGFSQASVPQVKEGNSVIQILQDVSRSLSEIRETVARNRRASEERRRSTLARTVIEVGNGSESVAENECASTETSSAVRVSSVDRPVLSPPCLRSRGRAIELPHVMQTPIEYQSYQ